MAAAWVVKRHLQSTELDTSEWEFIPAQYGDSKLINNLTQDCYENANINDNYIIVDFSLPKDLMILLASKASIIVLDHHKTAQANCEGLDFCRFDMNQSGAGLAWRHFFPDDLVPNLVKYIEDRDLWRFALPSSKEINSYIQSYPIEMRYYEFLATELDDDPYALESARNAGAAIERYKVTMVAAICQHARLELIGDYWVPSVQAPILFSEIGHHLCQQKFEYIDHVANMPYMAKPMFAVSWFIRSDNVKVYSLRSIGDFDVSEVAKKYGGGGHKNAAGFQVEAVRV